MLWDLSLSIVCPGQLCSFQGEDEWRWPKRDVKCVMVQTSKLFLVSDAIVILPTLILSLYTPSKKSHLEWPSSILTHFFFQFQASGDPGFLPWKFPHPLKNWFSYHRIEQVAMPTIPYIFDAGSIIPLTPGLHSPKRDDHLGGGFIFFIFNPTWGDDPNWLIYVSNGLVQPPTSHWIPLDLLKFFARDLTNRVDRKIPQNASVLFQGNDGIPGLFKGKSRLVGEIFP